MFADPEKVSYLNICSEIWLEDVLKYAIIVGLHKWTQLLRETPMGGCG